MELVLCKMQRGEVDQMNQPELLQKIEITIVYKALQ